MISKQRELTFGKKRRCYTGSFDDQQFINTYGSLAMVTPQLVPWTRLASYKQPQPKEREGKGVIDINWWLVLDASGSMFSEFIDLEKLLYVLLEESRDDANNLLHAFPLAQNRRIRSHIHIYGCEQTHKPLKKFDYESEHAERAARYIGYSQINRNYGSTDDCVVLEVIDTATNDPIYRKKLLEGKARDIVIMITDGGSTSPSETLQIIRNLRNKNVIVKGFRLDPASVDPEYYKQRFQEIFGSDGHEVTSVATFIPSIYAAFQSFLLNNLD